MWTCPKCGKNFRNCNQGHYCGKAPQTIEEYIREQPEEVQPILRQLQETIHASIPEAKEKISWSMPTFWKGCNLIQFAASQKHIGLYPGPEAVEAYSGNLGLLQKFLSEADDSRSSDAHALASARLKREFADTEQTELSLIRTQALKLLRAHTKEMGAKYGK